MRLLAWLFSGPPSYAVRLDDPPWRPLSNDERYARWAARYFDTFGRSRVATGYRNFDIARWAYSETLSDQFIIGNHTLQGDEQDEAERTGRSGAVWGVGQADRPLQRAERCQQVQGVPADQNVQGMGETKAG